MLRDDHETPFCPSCQHSTLGEPAASSCQHPDRFHFDNCFLPAQGKAAAAPDYPISRLSYSSKGFSTHRHSITESHETVMQPESFLADD